VATGPVDDYYALLGITRAASEDELRSAWRKLALLWHPDHAGEDATAMFQRLSLAYEVLSDPNARAAYDRFCSPRDAAPPPVSTTAPRRAPGVLIHRLSSRLEVLVNRGIANQVSDTLIELSLDREEVRTGGMVSITMHVPVRCPQCEIGPLDNCGVCDGDRVIDDLFSAWLAVRPGVADGTILTPSAWLPRMLQPVYFRVRTPTR
jgi:DnaJ-class molecular chaperone